MAFEVTDNNFKEVLLDEEEIRVVEYSAEWCGSRKMISLIIEEQTKEYEGKALIGKVNVDEHPDLCVKFGIRSIPTSLFLKNGEVVDKLVGAPSKQVLSSKVDEHLS